ncbi:hypothetical protein LRAMOSA01072 [Lichtheimia ramosa]|uniref:C2H2-type domain-containing protein n=1 Tax=Lichtheimia ramosa TaxID=688394 RepID=A0A077W9I8_9FUNG|nr:hypothetical protein LRAMOSA01072 [Lichtheimia ramosa]
MNQKHQVSSTMPYSATNMLYDDPLLDLSCLLSSFSYQDTFVPSPMTSHDNDPHPFSYMQPFTTSTMDNDHGSYVPPATLPILEDATSSTMSHASLSPTPSFPSSPYALSLSCNNLSQSYRPVDYTENDTITPDSCSLNDSPKKSVGRRIKQIPPYASNMVNLYFPKKSTSCIKKQSSPRRLALPKVTQSTPEHRRMFTCDVEGCNKTFTRSYNLKSHKRTHTLERPFACSYCPKQFARQHDRNRHARLHSGIKAYICQHCQKGFARQDALNRHQKPSLEKGYPCCKKRKGK